MSLFLPASSWVIQTTAAMKMQHFPRQTNYCAVPNRMTSIAAGPLLPLKAVFPLGKERLQCLAQQCTVPRRSIRDVIMESAKLLTCSAPPYT